MSRGRKSASVSRGRPSVDVRFRLEAVSDVVLAREWYDEQRPGLGGDSVRSLEDAVDVIAEFPEAFPEIAAGHRRAILRRFPYFLYYRIGDDGVEVLACLHGARSPSVWRSRG
ncbi:MAG: type II toxin-antitoxin system RelE/ParE family toxin [Gemmatimonadales bacterium]|nr:MAG: type II toxin-antitoxin system RelE/ParE family toxin [Gemmatimonadales bacterium]